MSFPVLLSPKFVKTTMILPHPGSRSSGLPLKWVLRSGRGGVCNAFSLVEVVVALGIIAVSLLSVMGLIPVGLTTMRNAMDSTVESEILRKINAEALLTPFSQLSDNFGEKTFYYDQEGGLLASAPAEAPAATRYWVTTKIEDPVYPGSSNAAVASSLSALNISIKTSAGTGATSKATNIYNVQIPNSGN